MRLKIGPLLAITGVLVVLTASASWSYCFEEAGEEYGIAAEILFNIASVESGLNPKAVNWNSNGTYDYGLMQINSSWEKTLGRQRWMSLSDPCTNVKTGAWILSQCLSRYGYTWEGIGCYNSRTPSKNRVYAAKVYKSMMKHRRQTQTTVAMSRPQQEPDRTPWEAIFGNAVQ